MLLGRSAPVPLLLWMSSGEACPGAARTRRAARTGGDQERLGHGTGEAGKARNHRAWWRETRVLRGVPYYSSAVAARSMRRLNAPPLRAPASRGLRQRGRGRSWNPKAKRPSTPGCLLTVRSQLNGPD